MNRYTLWADEIVLKSSDILDDVLKVARFYDGQYDDMYIIDNNFDKIIWDTKQ